MIALPKDMCYRQAQYLGLCPSMILSCCHGLSKHEMGQMVVGAFEAYKVADAHCPDMVDIDVIDEYLLKGECPTLQQWDLRCMDALYGSYGQSLKKQAVGGGERSLHTLFRNDPRLELRYLIPRRLGRMW